MVRECRIVEWVIGKRSSLTSGPQVNPDRTVADHVLGMHADARKSHATVDGATPFTQHRRPVRVQKLLGYPGVGGFDPAVEVGVTGP